MTNDKDSAVTQADIDAVKLYLQGTGPWALDEIGIGPDDSLVQAFARHRLEERAKIVAWLRKEAIMSTDTVRKRMNKALDQIEAGGHLK
jgi:hypothetical protein